MKMLKMCLNPKVLAGLAVAGVAIFPVWLVGLAATGALIFWGVRRFTRPHA